jgi:signal transduction histidine kinase
MTMTAEQTLKAKHELIGRIAAGLAHELNGPIGIALGFTELARESLATTDVHGANAQTTAKVNEYLGLIESSARRARELARGIWNFAKAEPGTIEDFDLAELLRQAASLTGPAVKVGSLEVVPRNESPLDVNVHGDRAMALQGLVHVLLASMEALPAGGSVYWEVTGLDGEFSLTAEPWGDMPSQEWPVSGSAVAMFESQGGTLSPSRSVGGSGKSGLKASSPAWIVTGKLPVVAGQD